MKKLEIEILRDCTIKAIQYLDKNPWNSKNNSKTGDLVYEGKLYPTKPILWEVEKQIEKDKLEIKIPSLSGGEQIFKFFETLGFEIKRKKMDTFKKLIEKYEEQHKDVRNDREFQAIAREIENQQLDIRLAEKAVRDTQYKIERKQKQIEETTATLEERRKDLNNKKDELDSIVKESEEEEAKLMKEREKRMKNVADTLYLSYERIRENARNGLAVVNVKRNACGGCFNIVPPQRQVDIKEKKKLVVCEHCWRVFADVETVEIVEKKRTTRRKRVTKKEELAEAKAQAEQGIESED